MFHSLPVNFVVTGTGISDHFEIIIFFVAEIIRPHISVNITLLLNQLIESHVLLSQISILLLHVLNIFILLLSHDTHEFVLNSCFCASCQIFNKN